MSRSAFRTADILIPQLEDLTDWSVIACDQFTSEREYWDRVTARTRDRISTRHMVLPEAYLADGDVTDAVESINSVMRGYLRQGIFRVLKDSFVYVEREVTAGVRRGLVGALDLDMYDFDSASAPAVRASEATVMERLPAREQIRRGASLELPHIMVLIDDADRTVVEPLTKIREVLTKLYDFELMEDGGRIKGWQACGTAAQRVNEALEKLAERDVQIIIGDGNHSLAAAKMIWERTKRTLTEQEREDHPARYALVELCNVYDGGVTFEPIHRIIFNVDPEKLLETMREHIGARSGWEIKCLHAGVEETMCIKGRSFGGMVATLEEFLEEYEAMVGGTVDYIHDEESLVALTEQRDSVGFFMPVMGKEDFFRTVQSDGIFPKKSFSIGHARDKRYYLECRKIVRDAD